MTKALYFTTFNKQIIQSLTETNKRTAISNVKSSHKENLFYKNDYPVAVLKFEKETIKKIFEIKGK